MLVQVSPQRLKCCCWVLTPGFLAPVGEEFNPGPEMRLNHSELLCHKVLLKYKRERESFWHRHQKGAERVPCCWFIVRSCYIWLASCKLEKGNDSKLRELHQAPHPQHAFGDNIGSRWVIPGHKTIDMNLEERQISKQIHSFVNTA